MALAAAWLGGGIFIRRPINKLLVATRRWREGDYSARARLIKRSSEIGTLGQAFDEMADAVEGRERQRQAAEAALARLNTELEQRVKDEVGERERAQQALVQAQKIEAVDSSPAASLTTSTTCSPRCSAILSCCARVSPIRVR